MKVIKQSVFDKWQIEDKSVQAVITSPPYYALRKYDIPDVVIGDWQGQYGLEPDHNSYVEHTRLWAKEAWRVLKDDGVFFLNIADSYNGNKTGHTDSKNSEANSDVYAKVVQRNIRPKCQLLIPHRVAMALVDDGWILRNTIIWHKPNAMPESVTDRFSKKYEYVFMFTKNEKYYFDLDAVRESHKSTPKYGDKVTTKSKAWGMREHGAQVRDNHDIHNCYNPKGKNPGDIFVINTQPSPEKHFAMWPEKLVERMVLCSTKVGDMVLDPFAGSGTTLRVADRLNRIGQGIDLGYQDIQNRRLKEIQKGLVW